VARDAGPDRDVALPRATPSHRWTSRRSPPTSSRSPEIATVGWSQQAVDAGEIAAEVVTLPLPGNARAKMQGVHDGFVKLFCRPAPASWSGRRWSGPRASELIHPVSIAVAESLTADQLAQAFTVYPSMSGSVAEAARRLHHRPD
jgi:dihydrolipoamide dehydrogenase